MRDDQNPTARALTALELIQASPGISAERIAERLGVSQRAARRYVATLREADIPIVSVRGPYGGYSVGRGLRPPPFVFTPAEALGAGDGRAGRPPRRRRRDPAGRDRARQDRAVAARVRRGPVRAVRDVASPAPDRAAARPDPTIATTLVQACSARRVRLDYRSENGNAWQAEVEPWAVVVRHGRWYLLCHSTAADARRAYRVDRVGGVEVLAQTFVPPADLDPVASSRRTSRSGGSTASRSWSRHRRTARAVAPA